MKFIVRKTATVLHCIKPILFIAILIFSFVTFSHGQLSRLRADGQRIVNASNQEVILKGVGLGGWLLQEGYMMNPNSGGTQWSFKKILYDQGQTDAQVDAFYQSWRDNFITQTDINWIADQGFNCVRIPMHYDLFLTASQRAVRNSVARNSANYTNYVNSMTTWYNNNQLFTDPNTEGFRTLENCLNWCAARNMYVIVDLHAAPGAQGSDSNISDALVANDLWNRALFQNVTVRLWEAIVRRYINNNTVAFWDLINEPNNVPGGGPAIFSLTNRLVNAVRALGDTHLIMIEGNGWGNNYDYLEPFNFNNQSNLVYNAHRYWIPEGDDNIRDPNPNQINRMINLTEFRARWNVPVWIGETGENTDAWLRQNVDKLNAAGIGWCHWTYKRTSSTANAALRRIPGPPYLTEGVSAMSSVLNNIRFANNVTNTGPLAAVDPRRGAPSTSCTGAYATVPGTIQAEAYCAMSGIQTETTTDAGGGQNIGYTDAGDWLGYRINVPSAGTYTVQYRVASQNGGGSIRLERFGGGTVLGTITVPSTGGWQTWQTISHTVQLTAGQQEIGLAVVAAGFNLNWISITSSTSSSAPIGQVISLRGINNLYVSGENGTRTMQCNRATVGDWERFTVVDAGSGTIALRSMNKYVSSENGVAAITCSRTTIGGWERFTWVANADGTISLRGNNNRYISSENGTTAMTCNRTSISGWEAFNWAVAGAGRMAAPVTVIEQPAAADDQLEIFPNPSSGEVSIRTGIPGTLVITDMAGHVVWQANSQPMMKINMLKAGVYMVSVRNDKITSSTKKLVITK